MTKKIFTAAWLVLTFLVSYSASAAVTYTNSVNDATVNTQSSDAEVVPGGTVRANDIIMVFGAVGDADADDEIVIRLPDGLNFSKAPTFSLVQATATTGALLKDAVGDPALETAATSLSDTNGDGLNDRASVIAATQLGGNGGDTLTISVHVTADADLKGAARATASASKATVVITGKALSTVDLVKVVKSGPPASNSGANLTVAPITANATGVNSVSATFNVTIPAGATNGSTVTITPKAPLYFLASTSTLKISKILSAGGTGTLPLTATVSGNIDNSATGLTTARALTGHTNTVTLAVAGAPTATGALVAAYPDPIIVEFTIDTVGVSATTAAKAGNRGVTIAGTAGASSSADLITQAATGSKATAAKPTKIVSGAAQYQELPMITITENFNGNAIDTDGAATRTITVKAGTGLAFKGGSSGISVKGNARISGVGNGGTYTTTVSTFLLTALSGGTTKTITIEGLKAISSAVGSLTVTVSGASSTAPQGDVLTVASSVERGTSSVEYLEKGTGAAAKVITKKKVGAKGSTSAKLTLKETTYGAITTANATGATSAYIRFTPANAEIITMTIAGDSNYTGGTAPTFGGCVEETKDSPIFVCTVTTESSGAFKPGTATITANITLKAKGAVGDVISVAVDGNTGVTGSADVADIVVATSSEASVVPQVTIGSSNVQKLAPVTVTRGFAGSTNNGYFRLLAPEGVKFANPGNITKSVNGGSTATVTASTFATNDTLVIYQTLGAASLTLTFTPEAFISADVPAGDIAVDILDGDINGKNTSSITEEAVNVAYAVAEIDALTAGKAITVGANYSATNTREGGVGDITAASSDTDVATVAVSGDSITVTGVAAGAATVTVTDSLGATAAIAVTVTAAELTEAKAGKSLSGEDLPTGTDFKAGASSDGGATQATEFTTEDDVELVATVTVGDDIVGEAGAIHIALMSKTDDGTTFSYLDEDGKWAEWDITGLPGVHIDAEELEASYSVSIYSGKFAAGTYRIALAYSSGGEVYYTGKAITITVTE
jgi:hypothetical protein